MTTAPAPIARTIHGHPRFTDWQAAKLPPNPVRAARNAYGDQLYVIHVIGVTFRPIVEAFLDLGRQMVDAFAVVADTLGAALEGLSR